MPRAHHHRAGSRKTSSEEEHSGSERVAVPDLKTEQCPGGQPPDSRLTTEPAAACAGQTAPRAEASTPGTAAAKPTWRTFMKPRPGSEKEPVGKNIPDATEEFTI